MRGRIQSRGQVIGLASALLGLLSGCTNMSGVGGGSKYACKAPEGVACDSVSGTYANALHNNLPSQRQSGETSTQSQPSTPSQSTAPRRTLLPSAPALASTGTLTPTQGAVSPLRSQARILRLWTKPWEDADGDLYDQGYVYVQINNGQWMIDHVQRQIRDAYAPLRPPPKAAQAASNVSQGTGSTTEPAEPSRTAPEYPMFPSLGKPSVRIPSGTSFNRVQ